MALRFQTNHHFTDIPIPTTRLPPPNTTTIRRAKTLIRPERGVATVPLINPPAALLPSSSGPRAIPTSRNNGCDLWVIYAHIVTFWAPDFLLSSLAGLKDKHTRQAWREKIALCFIIFILCGFVGFATVGFQKVLCPQNNTNNHFIRLGAAANTLGIQGVVFNVTSANSPANVDFSTLAQQPGQDITTLFNRDASDFPACRGLRFRVALDPPCTTITPCPLGNLNSSSTFKSLSLVQTSALVGYDWDQVAALNNYFVIDGAVLNMGPYMTTHPNRVPSDDVDTAVRTLMQTTTAASGKDGTRLFSSRAGLYRAVPCLKERYYAGNIDKITPGCFVSQLFLYTGLIVILGLVFVRFIMACVFNWFLSAQLAGPPSSRDLNRSAISPAVMPEGANISVDNKNGTAPWAGPGGRKIVKGNNLNKSVAPSIGSASSTTLAHSEGPASVMSLAQIGAELFAVCLVTCYSEGEDSLRTTLDSISRSTYSDARKLLFVVADGMITGAGEKKSTPDICVSLLDADPRFGNPTPMSYIAVGSGPKKQNRAMVYAGHYSEYRYFATL
jgi:chitin synthase